MKIWKPKKLLISKKTLGFTVGSTTPVEDTSYNIFFQALSFHSCGLLVILILKIFSEYALAETQG